MGFGWPREFLVAGAVDGPAYHAVIRTIESELEQNAATALRDESELVVAARELGLSPEPTGTNPHHWRARCPDTNHGLMIHSESDTFGCGYCRRRGGPDELRAFVEARRSR